MNLVFLKNPKFGVGCVSLLLAFVVAHPNNKEKKVASYRPFRRGCHWNPQNFMMGAIEDQHNGKWNIPSWVPLKTFRRGCHWKSSSWVSWKTFALDAIKSLSCSSLKEVLRNTFLIVLEGVAKAKQIPNCVQGKHANHQWKHPNPNPTPRILQAFNLIVLLQFADHCRSCYSVD